MAKIGRILSGMRPTGKLHIGHLKGALENWAKLQDEYHCIFEIADWHSLTTAYKDTKDIHNNIREMVKDFICTGIDPEKSIIFLQSRVLEHAELHLLFSMITPTPWLIRNPTVKEQARDLGFIEDEDTTKLDYGHLGYPILQAADILIYLATTVPVGEDQVPHVEFCRELARRFNSIYKKVFPEPQAKLTPTPKILGTDGRKMSKSLGNCIYIADEQKTVTKQVKKMVTDTNKIRKGDPGNPDICSVYKYHKIFSTEEENEPIAKNCKTGDLGCADCKNQLAENIYNYLTPYREKRQELEENPEFIEKVIDEGTEKARDIAQKTMMKVRKAMKML